MPGELRPVKIDLSGQLLIDLTHEVVFDGTDQNQTRGSQGQNDNQSCDQGDLYSQGVRSHARHADHWSAAMSWYPAP